MSRPISIDKERVSGLSEGQWERIAAFFAETRDEVMPHDLANQAHIRYEQAFALLNVLSAERAATLKLLIYHDCSEAPVRLYRYGVGYPRGRWECPNCEVMVGPEDVLGYDVVAKRCRA